MFPRTLVLLALLSSPCLASEVLPTDRVLPLIQDGGGWNTTITIVNLEATPARFELHLRTGFFKDWPLTVSGDNIKSIGGTVSGSVPANSSTTFRTVGAGPSERGYAMLYSLDGGRLGATCTIDQPLTGISLNVPLIPEREDKLVIPFDNTEGAGTALVWLSETLFSLVDYRALNSDGTEIVSGRYQFSSQNASSQEMFILSERFPELKGRKGTFLMELNYPNTGLYDDLFFSAFAIQTMPSGALFSIRSMAGQTWKASKH